MKKHDYCYSCLGVARMGRACVWRKRRPLLLAARGREGTGRARLRCHRGDAGQEHARLRRQIHERQRQGRRIGYGSSSRVSTASTSATMSSTKKASTRWTDRASCASTSKPANGRPLCATRETRRNHRRHGEDGQRRAARHVHPLRRAQENCPSCSSWGRSAWTRLGKLNGLGGLGALGDVAKTRTAMTR